MTHLNRPDVITALRYDTCEKLESCEPCKGVRVAALEAMEDAKAIIESAARLLSVAAQWDPECGGASRDCYEWLTKHCGFKLPSQRTFPT